MTNRWVMKLRLLVPMALLINAVALGVSGGGIVAANERVKPSQVADASEPAVPLNDVPASCTIDLVSNTHTCDGISALRFLQTPSGGQTALALNLDPRTSGFTQARFDVTYNAEPSGFTVDIGDSATNNGGAGDAGTQSNDAELQVLNRQFSLFGNDDSTPSRVLQVIEGFAAPGTTVSFTIRDTHVDWRSAAGATGALDSPYLYALNGQPDREGPVNYDLYAAFNRVIDGTYRSGNGASRVVVTLQSAGTPARDPFAVPPHNDSTFVVDRAPDLDTGCSSSGDRSLNFTIAVDRVVGNRDLLIDNGLLAPTAVIRMPAYDIAFAGGNGINPERDRVYFNDHLIPAQFLTGSSGNWKLNSFTISTKWVSFPSDPGDNQTRAPVNNTIRIDIDTGNTKTLTCTSIDWASLSIAVARPVLLVHGILSSKDTWKDVWTPNLRDKLGLPTEAIDVGRLGSIQDNSAKIRQAVDRLLVRWGVDQINIVSHSKGGLDSRDYVEQHNTVATLAQMGTPNAGSPLASAIQRGLISILGIIGTGIVDLLAPAAYQLTPQYMSLYNSFHGRNANTRYVSLAGDYRFGGFLGGAANFLLRRFYGDNNDLIVPVSSVHALPYALHLRYRSDGGNHQARHTSQTSSPDIYKIISPLLNAPHIPLPTAQLSADSIASLESVPVSVESTDLPAVQATSATSVASLESAPVSVESTDLSAVQATDLAGDQSTDPITATGTIADTIMQGQTKTRTLYMDGTQPIGFMLYHGTGDLNLALISPSGVRIDPSVAANNPNIDFESFLEEDGLRVKLYGINAPEVGVWTLEVSAASVTNPSGQEPYFLIGLFSDTRVNMTAATDRPAYHSGDPVIIHATLRDGAAPISQAQVGAKVVYPNQSFTNFILSDDGTGDDQAPHDGIYTGRFSATSQAGLYQLLVTGAGPAATPFTREQFLLAPVSAGTSRFNGTFADAGSDTDSDGLFNDLVVDVGMDVTQPASYRILGELADTNGTLIATATALADLNAGAQTLSLRFDGAQIYQHGVDGPYHLRVVRVAEDDGAAILPLDERSNAYTTASYDHRQFQHAALAALDQTVTTDEDTSVDMTLGAESQAPSAFSFNLVTPPSHGLLTGTAPHLTYTPETNFNGTDLFTFNVSDGTGDSNLATVIITVNPVNDPPALADIANQTLDEGTTTRLVVSAADLDGDDLKLTAAELPTFATFTDNGDDTGTLVFAPGFAAAGTYHPTVTVSDGSRSDTTTFTLTVNNINRPPVADAGGPYTAREGDRIILDATHSADPDADGAIARYDWDLNNDGAYDDAIGSTTPVVFNDQGIYPVGLRVTDDQGAQATTTTRVTVENVPPNVQIGPAQTANEGAPTAFTLGAFSDPGADQPWAVDVDWGDGLSHTNFTVTSPGILAPQTHTYADNGAYSVVVTLTDKDGAADIKHLTVTVANIAPILSAISAPLDPVKVNTVVVVSATFTDPGRQDTHTAVWDWNDGSSSTGTVIESNGAGSISATHTYTTAGIYTVKLTVTDKDGGASTMLSQYIVIYDPNGGFVTGGGWLISPVGAYLANPTLTGRVNFGFVSKYTSGTTVPTGQTQFQFQLANLNFHSDTYEWLVMAGARAQYKGTGTINGTGAYSFLITVIDGQITGGGGSDKLRVKIWNRASGATVYDNQIGATDVANPTTRIQGGSIMIHQ